MNRESRIRSKDAFIGPEEVVSNLMMTQTKDKLFHQLKCIYRVNFFNRPPYDVSLMKVKSASVCLYTYSSSGLW